MNRYNDIPLNEDFNNWWYFGRRKILNLKIKKYLDFNAKELSILEIGPGTGANITELQKFGTVDVLEIDDYFIELISNNNSLKLNNIFKEFKEIKKNYDLIVILDVLEHIEKPKNFLEEIHSILSENGLMILSVPAHQSLFSEHDVLLKHYRRYSMESLAEELREKFVTVEFFWFNFLLFPFRFIQIKIMKGSVNSDTSVSYLVNKIFTLIVSLELIFIKFKIKTSRGVSIFCIAKKIR